MVDYARLTFADIRANSGGVRHAGKSALYNGLNSMLLGIVVLLLLALVIMAITSGVVYSHWLDLIGKGATLGKNKFNIYVSTKRCVVIFMGNGDFVAVYHHFYWLFIFRIRSTADGLYVWSVQ